MKTAGFPETWHAGDDGGALLGWDGLAGAAQKAAGALYAFPPPSIGPWDVRDSRSPS